MVQTGPGIVTIWLNPGIRLDTRCLERAIPGKRFATLTFSFRACAPYPKNGRDRILMPRNGRAVGRGLWTLAYCQATWERSEPILPILEVGRGPTLTQPWTTAWRSTATRSAARSLRRIAFM